MNEIVTTNAQNFPTNLSNTNIMRSLQDKLNMLFLDTDMPYEAFVKSTTNRMILIKRKGVDFGQYKLEKASGRWVAHEIWKA